MTSAVDRHPLLNPLARVDQPVTTPTLQRTPASLHSAAVPCRGHGQMDARLMYVWPLRQAKTVVMLPVVRRRHN